jgi:lysozyme
MLWSNYIKKLKAQLERHEGKRKLAYKCPAGKITVGIGRNLEDKGLSDDEIYYLLGNDIKDLQKEFEKIDWYRKLSKARKCIMLNMAFNMGIAGLLKFRNMIQAIKAGDYNKAADEMQNSKWYAQVRKRADELVKQFRYNIFF